METNGFSLPQRNKFHLEEKLTPGTWIKYNPMPGATEGGRIFTYDHINSILIFDQYIEIMPTRTEETIVDVFNIFNAEKNELYLIMQVSPTFHKIQITTEEKLRYEIGMINQRNLDSIRPK